ncbi:hypothetical protein DYL61_22390 [Pseudomonas nabeulensis]|uniref:Uncharacterized protein n=1 Tax=Pseudomonas nabeulensis TaxID=2293833 RepID=A0A4Z0ASW3_9PSED|nr:hypothetical protein DYL61_22390 [Pseudomonas nabeulensis]
MVIDLWPVNLWRASLLALGCEAAPKQATRVLLEKCGDRIGAASRPSASKLARHNKRACHNRGNSL